MFWTGPQSTNVLVSVRLRKHIKRFSWSVIELIRVNAQSLPIKSTVDLLVAPSPILTFFVGLFAFPNTRNLELMKRDSAELSSIHPELCMAFSVVFKELTKL